MSKIFLLYWGLKADITKYEVTPWENPTYDIFLCPVMLIMWLIMAGKS